MKGREINLLDLAVEILLRWRVFAVVMVVCAALTGAFSYVQSLRAAKAEAVQLEEARQRLEQLEQMEASSIPEKDVVEWAKNQLDDIQIQNVEYALIYEDMLKNRQAYREQSVKMQMDSDKVHRVAVTFYITSEDREKSYSIEKVYENIVRSAGTSEYLADTLNMQLSDVTELISLQSDVAARLDGKDSFTVEVIHYDERTCMNIARAIIRFIDQQHTELEEMLGEHEIIALEPTAALISSPEILNYQRDLINDLVNLQYVIDTKKNAFSADEWLYYDVLVNGEVTDLSSEKFLEQEMTKEEREDLDALVNAGPVLKAGVNLRYVILGALLSAFIYAAWRFVIYILNTKIRATDNLWDFYAIPQLGLIPGAEREKKFLGIIDQWILSLRDRNKRKFSSEEALDLSSVAVKMSAEQNSLNTVYLIGCNLKEGGLAVCEKIQKKLNENNISAHILNNVLYDAQAMSRLEDARGVVLVEKAGSTLYNEITKELELLKRQNIKVLGGIMVE